MREKLVKDSHCAKTARSSAWNWVAQKKPLLTSSFCVATKVIHPKYPKQYAYTLANEMSFLCISLVWHKIIWQYSKSIKIFKMCTLLCTETLFLHFICSWKHEKFLKFKILIAKLQNFAKNFSTATKLPNHSRDSKCTRLIWVFLVLGISKFASGNQAKQVMRLSNLKWSLRTGRDDYLCGTHSIQGHRKREARKGPGLTIIWQSNDFDFWIAVKKEKKLWACIEKFHSGGPAIE